MLDCEGSIPGHFERIVRDVPDRVALMHDNRTMSFREANRASNHVARIVMGATGLSVTTLEQPKTVALLLSRSIESVAALIGVLKAGKTCVALDPGFPEARLRFILDDSQAVAIVADDANHGMALRLAQGRPVVSIRDLDIRHDLPNPELAVLPQSPAMLFYTSGSSGWPKGVPKTHFAALYRAFHGGRRNGLSPSDRVSMLSTPIFGGAASGLFDSLLHGACSCQYDLKTKGVSGLVDWLVTNEITVFTPPIAALRVLLEAAREPIKLPRLRLITLGGAVATRDDLRRIGAVFPESCKVQHRYSLTETGPICWYDVDESTLGNGPVPIGTPFPGVDIQIVDESGVAVPDGEPGEIYVTGPTVAPSYWRNPVLTKAQFRHETADGTRRTFRTGDRGRRRPDGLYELLGRMDLRVKVRGYSVDLAEIERVLLEAPGVLAAAATRVDEREADGRLAAYVAPHAGATLVVDDLRIYLRGRLPEYMVPEAFVVMESLPVLANGKVDRRALPIIGRTRDLPESTYAAPRTPFEGRILEIWSEVLGIAHIGVHDPFVSLGGNSLLAARIISRVAQDLGVSVPLKVLMDAPTIADMATAVVVVQASRLGAGELDRLLSGSDKSA